VRTAGYLVLVGRRPVTIEIRALLYAALACTRVKSAEPGILLARRWLDS